MWNRRKTLLRDHSVPEVTLKACPRHYSVSAIPETLTVHGPKRTPMVLHASNYDFSKALRSGTAILSLSQYHAISTLSWQSFSPSLADELQAKEGTSQPGTGQLE